jgi:hypothetical protein
MKDVHYPHTQVIPSFDGIREISVLIVVLAHSGLEALVPGGLGVTIFFFLSGFLITTLMLAENRRTGEINILKFYARRMFRLMPPLFISLAIAYCFTCIGLLSGGITIGGLAAQFYFANYYGLFFDPGNTVPDGTGILWSLAVEEHFYIVYPLFIAVLLGIGIRLRAIGLVLGIGCLVILAWRVYLVHSPHFVVDRTYYASDTRIASHSAARRERRQTTFDTRAQGRDLAEAGAGSVGPGGRPLEEFRRQNPLPRPQGPVGPKKAAVAANLLRVVYHVLKDGTCYHDLGEAYRRPRAPPQTSPTASAHSAIKWTSDRPRDPVKFQESFT